MNGHSPIEFEFQCLNKQLNSQLLVVDGILAS